MMNPTNNHLESIKREEGQKKLLERTLEAHRNRKWVINLFWTVSILVVILSFSFHLSKSVGITGILLLICVISQIVHKTLDMKIELRLKRVKQEKQKSIFKLNKF